MFIKQVQTPHADPGIASLNFYRCMNRKGILLNVIKINYSSSFARRKWFDFNHALIQLSGVQRFCQALNRGDRLINGRCPGCKVLCAIPGNVLMDCPPPVRLIPAHGLETGGDFWIEI